MSDRPYTFTHVAFDDAGATMKCAYCDAVEPVTGPPGIATAETEAFVNFHRPCAGDAA